DYYCSLYMGSGTSLF
nr:immunoglobulin light chain junction region [Macaca mulatta]MOW28019.1 immunoglobulin light chain junction region [Macaca mulatta]MOW28071.1 immunoglobulin light chain junction region [Macaca mulatta]MOW28484.1 immunoglobulin light chain junction region [Macaca mulatta]MOW28757.1 immunoglobulin light chain junction region [Macaca mulatta]